MKFSVSNSCFPVDSIVEMAAFPAEFGIEVQIEFGTDYYWKTVLPKVMAGRTGNLSIHGQFVDIDLSAAELDDGEIFAYYQWGFDQYKRHGASHFVIHPDGKLTAPATAAEVALRRERALERIGELSRMAQAQGVNLLVENLRPKGYGLIFDEKEFIELFDRLPKVGCLIDTGHMRLSDWNFENVITSLADKIQAYHINDTYGKLDEHKPVGQGVIDWKELFRLIMTHTPNAEMVLEYKGCTVDEIIANARMIQALAE